MDSKSIFMKRFVSTNSSYALSTSDFKETSYSPINQISALSLKYPVACAMVFRK